ncbi:MAG: phosphatase PAP2 family protein, partial [Nocardioidaceae bacterium]
MGWRRHNPTSRHADWTSEAASALALSGFLFLVFAGFTVLAAGPLVSLDAYFNLQAPPPGWVGFLHVLDRIGQRVVCLPILGVVAVVCARKTRSWRPLWLSGIGVLVLNLLVLALKVGLGRGQPGAVNPSFFVGGMAYPSGHTANIVLVYGLGAYLLGRHRVISRPWRAVAWSVVAVLAATMVATSLTLNWHWFADLVAGLLVGAAVLETVVAIDAAA